MVIKGAEALLVIAGVIWIFWMSYVHLTKRKDKE